MVVCRRVAASFFHGPLFFGNRLLAGREREIFSRVLSLSRTRWESSDVGLIRHEKGN